MAAQHSFIFFCLFIFGTHSALAAMSTEQHGNNSMDTSESTLSINVPQSTSDDDTDKPTQPKDFLSTSFIGFDSKEDLASFCKKQHALETYTPQKSITSLSALSLAALQKRVASQLQDVNESVDACINDGTIIPTEAVKLITLLDTLKRRANKNFTPALHALYRRAIDSLAPFVEKSIEQDCRFHKDLEKNVPPQKHRSTSPQLHDMLKKLGPKLMCRRVYCGFLAHYKNDAIELIHKLMPQTTNEQSI